MSPSPEMQHWYRGAQRTTKKQIVQRTPVQQCHLARLNCVAISRQEDSIVLCPGPREQPVWPTNSVQFA